MSSPSLFPGVSPLVCTSSPPVPPLIAERCQYGDIWQIGDKHYVHCGDSTKEETVELLKMFTILGERKVGLWHCDPPYGINLLKKARGKVGRSDRLYDQIPGDENTDVAEKLWTLYSRLWTPEKETVFVIWGANYFSFLPASSCYIAWDKCQYGLSFADCEIAYVSSKDKARIFKAEWSGFRRGEESKEPRWHANQKPYRMLAQVISRYCKERDALIFDPCLGSGSSLIAVEYLNQQDGGTRAFVGVDIVPKFVDITLTRIERMTGKQAVLLRRTS